MAPVKRRASSAKRAGKRSRTDKRVPAVVGALADAEVLPANLRALLKSTLPIALNANKADRHAYETEVVNQAQQALGAVQGALEQAHKEALAKQNAIIAPAERANRVSAKKKADSNLEALKSKREANTATEKAAVKAVEEALIALKAAKKDKATADKDIGKLVAKRDALSNVLATEFVMVKTGTSALAAGKKAVQKLVALGKEHGLDSTLLSTFPITCKKSVELRTDFENMMFNSLEALINKVIAGLSQEIKAAEPVVAAKGGAVDSASAAVEKAEAAQKAAETELQATIEAQREASKEVTKAEHSRRRLWEDMRQACEAHDGLANDVKHFKEDIWTAFNQLKEKEPEPEPVEEPEPAAEAAEVPVPAEG